MKTSDMICVKCQHITTVITDSIRPRYAFDPVGEKTHQINYFCNHYAKFIHKVGISCPKFLSVTQTKVNGGDVKMVKIENIPTEGERVDFKTMPNEMELIAISEEQVEKSAGKTGGLAITYETRDKKELTQKYSPMFAQLLVDALKKLKLTCTEDLQKDWYLYKQVPARMGYPRMIPQRKVSK